VPNRDIIVIGASAGGLQPLRRIVEAFPKDLKAAVFIVWHISPHHRSYLPEILTETGKLNAREARDGEKLETGRIYVARPDHHLLVESGRVRLTKGPKENRFRPSVDSLFRSAAYAYGPRVIGVVLTGALDDGMAGLWAIKDRGGIAVVQDPAEAEQPSMPWSALVNVDVDYCLPVSEIAKLLVTLTRESVDGGGSAVPKELEIETRIALEDSAAELDVAQLGKISEFTCPDCHGSLIQISNGKLKRFRCHTGHSFGSASLLADMSDSVEQSIWTAIRAVEERLRLLKDLSQHAATLDQPEVLASLSRELENAEKRSEFLRKAAMTDVDNNAS